MHHRRHGDASQRAVDRFHRITFCQLRIVAHPGFIELNHVRAGLLQIERLGIDGVCEGHRELFIVLVEFVPGLLAHGEGAWQGDLGGMVGIFPQKLHVAQLDRRGASDLADHAGHCRLGVAGARHDDGGIVGIDAVKRGGEAVGVAFAADFAVGDDIDAGALHVTDRDDGRVILRLLQMFDRQPPHLMHGGARHRFRQHGAVDQPVRLRIAADDGGRQDVNGHGHGFSAQDIQAVSAALHAHGRERRCLQFKPYTVVIFRMTQEKNAPSDTPEFDYVIVGAGSAGCVLANRLSADGKHSVLLLGAGPRATNLWIHVPLGYGKLFKEKSVNWMYQTEPEPGLNGRQVFQPRGKVLGGSSSINGLLYVRGQHEDYDRWRQRGNAGWGYEDVLPYFKKAENQQRGKDEYHGTDGPLPVSDWRHHDPLSEAFVKAAGEAGISFHPDFKGAKP